MAKEASHGAFQGESPLDYALPLIILQICLVHAGRTVENLDAGRTLLSCSPSNGTGRKSSLGSGTRQEEVDEVEIARTPEQVFSPYGRGSEVCSPEAPCARIAETGKTQKTTRQRIRMAGSCLARRRWGGTASNTFTRSVPTGGEHDGAGHGGEPATWPGVLLFLFLVGPGAGPLVDPSHGAQGPAHLPLRHGAPLRRRHRRHLLRIFMGMALSITAFLFLDLAQSPHRAQPISSPPTWAAWRSPPWTTSWRGSSSRLAHHLALWVLLAAAGFVAGAFLLAQPVLRWMASRCREGEPVSEAHVLVRHAGAGRVRRRRIPADGPCRCGPDGGGPRRPSRTCHDDPP
ncbi:hypothetical protein PR202_gb24309 [Eleusine coracana subsp. coracana]|uniref:Uncharacterized protein n=1 Tax=Eleusine coracana subsp. coracana TaxID=191504 RepID=A0AAV5FL49_ELECO|nr:hypothetical protein PR202_gb24309 [Eleusine coracana subsp. coracana]